MNNNKESVIDFIFDSELKNYLALEKTIYEAFEMYQKENDDRIKYILGENIAVAKSQIFLMLEVLPHIKDIKVRENFENGLNTKLAELREIASKIKMFHK